MSKLRKKLADHFAAGGEPLDYKGVAELLGILPGAGSTMLTHLEQSNGNKWRVTIERSPVRMITSMVAVGREQTASDELRERLARQDELAELSNRELALRFQCSERLVSKIRTELGVYMRHRKLQPESTSGRVRIALQQNPDATTREIAEQLKCSPCLVSQVRRRIKPGMGRPMAVASNKIREALRQNPDAGSVYLARKFGCSAGLVSKVRKGMGLPSQAEIEMMKKQQEKQRDATSNKPRPAWSDEVPHLNRAAKFRQLWPVTGSQERAQ